MKRGCLLNKADLRKYYLKKLLDLSNEEKIAASNRACDFLLEELETTMLVGSYFSLKSEINLNPLNEFLAKEGKLALPRLEGLKIVYHRIHNLSKDLKKSALNIYEPHSTCTPSVDLADLSILLIPGLAYDSQNFRLGRGAGYYDRVLAQSASPPSLAAAYKLQKSDTPLPREPQDQPVDEVIYF